MRILNTRQDLLIKHQLKQQQDLFSAGWKAVDRGLARAIDDGKGGSTWLTAPALEGLIKYARSSHFRVLNNLKETMANALATGTLKGKPLKMDPQALRVAAELVGDPDVIAGMAIVAELKEALGPGPEGIEHLTQAECRSIITNADAQPEGVKNVAKAALSEGLRTGELFGRPFTAGASAIRLLLGFCELEPARMHQRFQLKAGQFRVAKRTAGLKPKIPKLMQLAQAARSGRLGMIAALYKMRRRQLPSIVARSMLSALKVMPVKNRETAAQAAYESKLSGVPADDAFQYFLNNAEKVFKAGGLGLIPKGGAWVNGARVLLSEGGPPPIFLPLQVEIEPEHRRIRLLCLDGHPFAGENRFQFVPSASGRSTLVEQLSIFEGSSPMVWLGQAMGAMTRQSNVWRAVHEHLHHALVEEGE